MNGTFLDAAGWFWADENEMKYGSLPFPIKLLHEHYDVWVTNYRGSAYSIGHVSLNSKTDPEYWKFSQLEKGRDQIDTIKHIKKVSKVDKVAYAGYSQGNSIMFHALATEDEENFFADNMSAFIALAPCTMPKGEWTADEILESDWKLLEEFPVLLDGSFAGEDNERLKKMCEISSKALCDLVTQNAEKNLKGSQRVRAATDTRSLLQYLQNSAEDRFQHFAEDY